MLAARKIGLRELRALVREAVFDDEGTPVGTGMDSVARTSETKLRNAVDDALAEDARFSEQCVRLAGIARHAVMQSEYVPFDAEELVVDEFEDDFMVSVRHAATDAIVDVIKSARYPRRR
jgi:hypothetical protein